MCHEIPDDIIPQPTNEIAISKSTPESSEDSSRIFTKVGTPEKLSIQDEGTGTNFEFPSPFPTAILRSGLMGIWPLSSQTKKSTQTCGT